MKKFFLVMVAVLCVSAAAIAQPRAVGLRGGYGIEATYQHTLGDKFVQADLGLSVGGLNIAGTYNWMIAQPKWTSKGEWGFYAGPGASLGFGVTPSMALKFATSFSICQCSSHVRVNEVSDSAATRGLP